MLNNSCISQLSLKSKRAGMVFVFPHTDPSFYEAEFKA